MQHNVYPGPNNTCICFRRVTQAQVVDAIHAIFPERDVFVSPETDAWVTVHDADCDEWQSSGDDGKLVYLDTLFSRFIVPLCRRLNCSAIAFACDAGIRLSYWLFDSEGNRVDCSVCPYHLSGKGETTPVNSCGLAGDLNKWTTVLDLPLTSSQIREVLEGTRYDLLGELGKLLGIPNANWGYRSLFRSLDELHDDAIPGWSSFIHVGDPDPRGVQ
jgi:hypothetical protein